MKYDNYNNSTSFFSNFLGSTYAADDLTSTVATVDPRAAFPVVASGSHLDEPGLWQLDNSMFELQKTTPQDQNLKQEPQLTFPWATLSTNEALELPAALPPLNKVSRPRSHLKLNHKDLWICECGFEANKNWKMSRHKKYTCPYGPKKVPQCPICFHKYARADSLTRHLNNPAQCEKNVMRRSQSGVQPVQHVQQFSTTKRSQSPQIDFASSSSWYPAPSLASDNSSELLPDFTPAPSVGSSSGASYLDDFGSFNSTQDDYTLFYPDN